MEIDGNKLKTYSLTWWFTTGESDQTPSNKRQSACSIAPNWTTHPPAGLLRYSKNQLLQWNWNPVSTETYSTWIYRISWDGFKYSISDLEEKWPWFHLSKLPHSGASKQVVMTSCFFDKRKISAEYIYIYTIERFFSNLTGNKICRLYWGLFDSISYQLRRIWSIHLNGKGFPCSHVFTPCPYLWKLNSDFSLRHEHDPSAYNGN